MDIDRLCFGKFLGTKTKGKEGESFYDRNIIIIEFSAQKSFKHFLLKAAWDDIYIQ